MAVENGYPRKRSSTAAELNAPTAKRPHLPQIRHHKLSLNLGDVGEQSLPSQDQDSIHSLLARSISLALETVGFQGAEPVAIEGFRAEAEECSELYISQAFVPYDANTYQIWHIS